MIATIGAGRRITIPKELFDQYGIKEGMKVDVTFEDGRFILTPVEQTGNFKAEYSKQILGQVKSQKEILKEKAEDKPKQGSNFKRKIVSNLEEAQGFSRKVYSDCGLVIRTKRSYLKTFCEECKGQLAKEHNTKCPLYDVEYDNNKIDNVVTQKRDDISKIMDSLDKNINKLQINLNKKIEDIKEETNEIDNEIDNDLEKDILNFYRSPDTTIFAVKLRNLRACDCCGELYDKGFIINEDDFFCKSCTVKDFKNYLKNQKENKEVK